MSPREVFALRDHLGPDLKGRTISDARRVVSLTNILGETCLADRLRELSRRSVLLAVQDQLISAIAMTELDGVARRMLLCPPDLNPDHVQTLIEDADIDAIVTDQPLRWAKAGVYLVLGAMPPARAAAKAKNERPTEWLMLTSGTSGVPKIVSHSLKGLTATIAADGPAQDAPPVWATLDDIRCYGGLQTLLRAVLEGGSMVLTEPGERIADHVRFEFAAAVLVVKERDRVVARRKYSAEDTFAAGVLNRRCYMLHDVRVVAWESLGSMPQRARQLPVIVSQSRDIDLDALRRILRSRRGRQHDRYHQ